jgi:anti-sigma regulatory factor (Ser/Thr protein kinase)
MSWQIEQLLAPSVFAPGAARAMANDQLAEQLGPRASELTGDVVLVLSELVTNAVAAGSTTIGVALMSAGESLRVEVTDDGTGWPLSQPRSTARIDGRGLNIVAALADQWGADPVPGGKTVWATFAQPASDRARGA